MFAAIHSGLTREDISIATVVAQHTGTVLNLLSKMAAEDRKYKMQNQTAVSHATSTLPPFFKLSKNKVLNETAVSETSSALPPFFRLNKNKVLNETAVSETSSRLPPFFRLSKHKEKHEVDLRATSPTLPHFFKLDKNKSHHPPKTAGVPSKQLKHIQVLSVDNHVDSLKVQASGFIQQSSSGYLQQSSTRWTKHKPTIRRPWSNKKVTSTGKRRKVKTLFTKFLSSKTRPIKAWRPQAQPLPGLFLVKQNTSRSIGSFHQSQWKDENLAREEINRLKKERASLKQVDSEEVRTEPEVKQPVASEEDFAKEFERKAGSLVSIGQNAIPLPGSRHPDRVDSHRVEDPLIDVAERAELRPADVSDLVRTTKAPVMRPRLRLTSAPLEGPVFAFTTPNPLWNPLLAFFSTPSPLYLSTHQPIQLWPFRKRRRKLHGAKIFLGEEASPIVSRNILPIPKEDKNNCVKLQECFTKLDEREKNCTTQSTKNGISTKKTSFCENLNWKFRIEELFKSLDVDFRTCVLKSDVENENMKECAVPPELPEEVYEKKDCHRNIVQMRQYCDQLANCCPIAQRCRSTVDNSQSAADLRLRQRRLAMIAANCEKSNSIKGSIKMKKKWLKIRDEAQH